jgi:uncharacterized protein (DUF4415 family)
LDFHPAQLKRQITIRLDTVAVDYFKTDGGRTRYAVPKPHQPLLE